MTTTHTPSQCVENSIGQIEAGPYLHNNMLGNADAVAECHFGDIDLARSSGLSVGPFQASQSHDDAERRGEVSCQSEGS